MHLTNRQRFLLNHLDRIAYRKKTTGTRGYFLDKDDCTATINSLIVKRVVSTSDDGQRLFPTPLAALRA